MLGDSWEVRRAAAGCRRATRASSAENGFDTFPPICGRAHTQIGSLLILLHPLSRSRNRVLSNLGCNWEREDAPDLPTLPPDISKHHSTYPWHSHRPAVQTFINYLKYKNYLRWNLPWVYWLSFLDASGKNFPWYFFSFLKTKYGKLESIIAWNLIFFIVIRYAKKAANRNLIIFCRWDTKCRPKTI